MIMIKIKIIIISLITLFTTIISYGGDIVVGAERIDKYINLLKGKKVGLLVNQTSVIKDIHLVDSLLSLGVDIRYIMSPEHGFRGDADAGGKVNNSVDSKSKIPIISLYGSAKKPSKEILSQIDIIVFDLQDVGVRFYTYLSTMHYVLEAAAENGKDVIILDRPNPNGYYVDGPILDMKHSSFVGIYPIPVVHGMTLGELAMMARGEKWCKSSPTGIVTVIRCDNYSRDMLYSLPISPSPNLKDMCSIYLYPSLCYFEATDVSVGRGTLSPFKVYGHPGMKAQPFSFTPKSLIGATNPPQKDVVCHGKYLGDLSLKSQTSLHLSLEYLIDAYNAVGRDKGSSFFTSFFEKLIGVDYVREMIIGGSSAQEIRRRWSTDVEKFELLRKNYLLYE